MSQDNTDPFKEFGGQSVEVSPNNDPFAEFGGSAIEPSPEKKSPSGSPSQDGLQGSRDGITAASGGIEVPDRPLASLPPIGSLIDIDPSKPIPVSDPRKLTQEIEKAALSQAGLKPDDFRKKANDAVRQKELGEVEMEMYVVDGKAIPAEQFKDLIFDQKFVEEAQKGLHNVQINPNNSEYVSQFLDQKLVDAASRNLQSGTRIGDKWESFMSGATGAASGIAGLESMYYDVVEEVLGIPLRRDLFGVAELQETSEELARKAEDYQQKTFQYRENFLNSILDGRFADAAQQAGDATAASVPYSAAAAALTYAGGPALAFSVLAPMSSSAEYANMKVSEDEAFMQLSKAEKLLRSNVVGPLEAGTDIIAGRAISRSFDLTKGLYKGLVKEVAEKQGLEAADQAAKELSKSVIRKYGENIGLQMTEEFFAEGGATAATMLYDDFMGIRSYDAKDYFTETLNSGLLGSVAGGITSGTLGGPAAIYATGLTANNKLKSVFDKKLYDDPSAVENLSNRVDSMKVPSDVKEDLKENLAKREKAVKAVPKEKVSDTETVDKVQRKQELQEEMSGLDPVYQEPIKEEIAAIDNELREGIKKEYPAPTVNTSPTEDRYASVNRNDGKGTVDLTQEEYLAEMERRGIPVEPAPTEVAPTETVEQAEEVAPAEEITVKSGPIQKQPLKPIPTSRNQFTSKLSDFSDVVYRETDSYGLLMLADPMRFGNVSDDYYFTNDPDLALGQGKNKGFIIEADASKLKGSLNTSKPGYEQIYSSGSAELIARYNDKKDFLDSILSVTVKPNAAFDNRADKRSFNSMVSGWEKIENADGSVTYIKPTPPTDAVQEQSTESVPVRQQPEARQEEVAPAEEKSTTPNSARNFNIIGREVGLDKPRRSEYEDGEKGDNEYAEENIKHNKKVDELILGIKEEGVLIDSQGNEYDVEITSQGVRVSPKNDNSYKIYARGKRVSGFTPFSEGFTFKPKNNTVIEVNPSEVESTEKRLSVIGADKDLSSALPVTTIRQINDINKQAYESIIERQKKLLSEGRGKEISTDKEIKDLKSIIDKSEKVLNGNPKELAEAYHKAKADGSNPELVKAVEDLLGPKTEQDAIQKPSTESVPVRQQPEARQGVREEDTKGQETPQEGEAVQEEVTAEAEAKQELVADEILMSGEAQKRRQEGKYEKDGVIFERNPEKDGPKGSTGNVRFAQGEQEMPFTFRLIEADELQPSHINGRRNPLHFLPEAQPKTRDDAASIKAEDDIAANPRLDLVGEDTGAYSGAPIVNKRGEVVQGNNRAAGLKKTYQRNNPSYKQQLAERAGEFGLTKEQVEGMKNPVLVREVAFSDDAAIRFGNYKAADLETGGKSSIDPVTVSARMPLEAKQNMLGMLFTDGATTLKAAIRDNFKRAAQAIYPYINAAQKNSIERTTTPSQKQMAEMEGVVLQFLFDGGDPNLSQMFERLSATQQGSILKAMPDLFSVPRDKSIVPEVQSAIGAATSFETSGVTDFDAWAVQSDMFNGNMSPSDVYTPTEMALAKILAESSNQSAFANAVRNYTEQVKGSSGDMFTPPTEGITKEEALKKQFNDETGGKKTVGAATPTMAPKKEDAKADKPTRKRAESKKSRDAKRDKLKQDIKSLKDDLYNDLNSLGFAATPEKLGQEAQEFTDKLIKLAKLSIQDAGMSLEDFIKEVLSKYTGKRTDVAELSETAYNAAKDAYIRETAKEMTSTEGRKETDNKFNEAHEEAFEFAENELSGIMNALVPEDKKGVYQKERRTVKETLERGKAMIQSGAIDPATFVQVILKSPRPLTADETAAMVYYKASLDARIEGLTKQSNEARENGDMEGVSLAELAISEVEAQIDGYYQFQEASGYEQGLSLKMRQLLITKEYELANQVRKYKRETGKTFVPAEVMAKFKLYDEAIRELSKRIDEFEKRSEEASESLEILSEPDPDKPKTKSDAAKLFANKVRQKKFVKSAKQLATLQSDPTGLFKFAWDSALEFIATTVEQGGTIADAVDGAIDKLKNSEWYKNLSKKGKDAFENTAKTSLSEEAMEYAGISIPTLIDGFLHIPDSFVKDLIKNGFDTIETATIEARRFLLENLGIEATERQVRDAISDYGKRSKLSKDEVSQKMREMKRVGKLLSALEDVQRKKRPLRSGRERDAMTQKEREIKREINALLKDIPQTSEETDAAWKSALDATKTRLRNRIEDIQKQIAEGKKTPKKKSIELDAEAKYLKEEVDRLNEILRSIEGKPEMTFEQRVRITEQAIERSIQEYERRIREKDFEPMSKEPVSTPEIEALRTKREQLRKQYSEEYSKSPAKDTARDSAAMKRLQKQIDELTEKIHGRISIESKKEAAKEYGAHVKAMQERVKSLRAALMETEQGKAIAEKRALENVKKATARSIQEYERRIREKDFAVKKSKQVALDTEAKALKAEQQKWKNRFDTEREKSRLDERTKTEKLREGLVDIIGVPKSLVASLDFSSVLRQGGLLSAKHPKMAVSATKEMIKQTFSEAAYEKWMDEFIVSDIYNDAKKAGLYIATPNAKLLAKEESFVSNIAEMIPIYGRLVRASNRAYSSYLNVMRIAVFADFQEQIDKSGLSEKDAELAKKDMAAFINNATGRGSLLGYEPNSPELNLLFFSPRFVLSRANIVMNTATGYAAYHPKVRKEALLTVAAYLSAVTTLILLSTMAGADAEDDPRSSDFGKIRTGKLRLDPLAGLSQMVTFFSRMITGQTKSLSTGEVSNLGEGRFGRNRLGVIGSFIRSKMSPAASALVDMADSPAGKTKKWGVPGVMEFENKVYFKNIVGEEQTLPERAISLMTPIYTQGAIEIYQEEGLLMAAAATGADIIGIGSQYHSTAGTESTEATLSKSEKELKKEISDFKASVLESMSKEAKGKYIPFEDADLFAGTDVPDRYEEKFSEKYRDVYGQQKELPSIDLDGIAKEHNMNVFKETDKKAGTGLAAIFVTGKDADGNSLKPPIKAAASFMDSKKKSLTEKQEKILSDFLNITLEDDSYLSDFKEELKRLQSK